MQRLQRVAEGDRPTFDFDRAFVRMVDADQTFHQRRFTRAVFPHQRVHAAGFDFNRDLIQRFDAGELLADAFGLKNIRVHTAYLRTDPRFPPRSPHTAPAAGFKAYFLFLSANCW